MIGYIAKDKDNKLYLYSEKPEYHKDDGMWIGSPDYLNITERFPEFDSMSYTDEPIKVEIKLERI